MEREHFDRFTSDVVDALGAEPTVIGVVALGSTAGVDREPDEWSDHDLWIVTIDGAAGPLRGRVDWLPDPDRIVVHTIETEHGRTAIYDDGHVLEFAVFDDHELEVASTNAYRVLLDHADIAERMSVIAGRTAERLERHADAAASSGLEGRFLSQLTIGVKRWARGERLSANDLIRHRAVGTLVMMLGERQPHPALDGLDPMRRVERAHPEAAVAIDRALTRPAIDAAASLLDVATSFLGDLDSVAVDTVRAVLDAARPEASSSRRLPTAHGATTAVSAQVDATGGQFGDTTGRHAGGDDGTDPRRLPCADG